ncbi:transmembrane protein 26-like [Spea bombifrons]|uniref:transmembrane protein 26-like n=1 Tax=Spea bombifrons TaxID=233779 RepID=UPI00234A98F3|nr:transmembrane protein 26-like [Spea bombifrons]
MMSKLMRILLAIVSRSLFTAHGVLLVWRVVEEKKNSLYWMLLIGLILVYVDMAVTLTITEKGEWKWFSPTVFLYLSSTIPSVFLLELDFLEDRALVRNSTVNQTAVAEDMIFNEPSQWLEALEQTMMLVLVIGRWLMPKGEMNRDQLTQLLLIYISLGADILDILQLIKEPAVETNRNVVIVGLSLYGWALLQFTLVLTQTNSSQSQKENDFPDLQDAPAVDESDGSPCCTNEVWSLITAVGMQDGPFLVFRLYLAIKEGIINELMIFFICKNILTVTIEIYRIVVVHTK